MKKIIFGLTIHLFLVNHHVIRAQNNSLYAIIDNKIVLVNATTAQVEIYKEIVELPLATNLAGLVYHSEKGVFYSIKDPSNSPTLVSISLEGKYHEIGDFTINGRKIKLSETLAFNKSDNKLYSAVSLNGGVQDNDFWSEAIVTVDPLTGACTFVTNVMTNVVDPDVDAMAFSDGSLYIFDGAPPGANFSKFFKIDFDNANSIANPQLIYDTRYFPITDFTILSQNIYFTEARNLRKFNFSNRELELVGQTHTSSEFNGNIIKGISNLDISNSDSCQTPVVDLGRDTLLCSGNNLVLEALYSNSNANYLWQDGSTNSSFIVSQPGAYWVKVMNSCGSAVDTVSVTFNQVPIIELGKDTILCPGKDLTLDVSYPGATIVWQDGLTDSIRIIDSPGVYEVTVENSCGSVTDNIEIGFRSFKNLRIPNVFTPNSDGVNEYFELDERLVGAKIKILNRWGKLIYQSNSYQNDWNGAKAPAGTYFYLIEDICSTNYKGWIQILHTAAINSE